MVKPKWSSMNPSDAEILENFLKIGDTAKDAAAWHEDTTLAIQKVPKPSKQAGESQVEWLRRYLHLLDLKRRELQNARKPG